MIFDAVSIVLISAGLFFMIVGPIGLLRLPDFYTRIHAAGKCDTLGQGLILLGAIVHEGFTLTAVKIAFLIAFIMITNPTMTHTLANAAYEAGVPAWRKEEGR